MKKWDGKQVDMIKVFVNGNLEVRIDLPFPEHPTLAMRYLATRYRLTENKEYCRFLRRTGRYSVDDHMNLIVPSKTPLDERNFNEFLRNRTEDDIEHDAHEERAASTYFNSGIYHILVKLTGVNPLLDH